MMDSSPQNIPKEPNNPILRQLRGLPVTKASDCAYAMELFQKAEASLVGNPNKAEGYFQDAREIYAKYNQEIPQEYLTLQDQIKSTIAKRTACVQAKENETSPPQKKEDPLEDLSKTYQDEEPPWLHPIR